MVQVFESMVSGWLLLAFALLSGCTMAGAQTTAPAAPAPLTADQVMARVEAMNQLRAEELGGYSSVRTYHLKLHGLISREAEMVVRVDYHAPRTKEFTVIAESGSAAVRNRVFRRLLEAELDSTDPKSQQHSAITRANYRFQLVDHYKTGDGEFYVLKAEPKTKDKYLFAGRIWVDADDFAVTKIDGQPAVNPSWWTRRTDFKRIYERIGEFWLPESNRSVTKVRIFGTAVMTISYRDYQITLSPVVTATLDGLGRIPGTALQSVTVPNSATTPHKILTPGPNP